MTCGEKGFPLFGLMFFLVGVTGDGLAGEVLMVVVVVDVDGGGSSMSSLPQPAIDTASATQAAADAPHQARRTSHGSGLCRPL